MALLTRDLPNTPSTSHLLWLGSSLQEHSNNLHRSRFARRVKWRGALQAAPRRIELIVHRELRVEEEDHHRGVAARRSTVQRSLAIRMPPSKQLLSLHLAHLAELLEQLLERFGASLGGCTVNCRPICNHLLRLRRLVSRLGLRRLLRIRLCLCRPSLCQRALIFGPPPRIFLVNQLEFKVRHLSLRPLHLAQLARLLLQSGLPPPPGLQCLLTLSGHLHGATHVGKGTA